MTKGINEELNQAMMRKIPLDRFGDPEDIAKTAIFLASNRGLNHWSNYSCEWWNAHGIIFV
ncbi:MAG: hypothetical protein Ct9H300mP6_14540 [Gammaproteobacteria bacterium]|nr:MAG: hypothetical protein Ct9H300mP6_14540 [Gammaproteobacteria bacterium]